MSFLSSLFAAGPAIAPTVPPVADPLHTYGYLPGTLSLNPQAAPPVNPGAARPFDMSEYLTNPNGSWSNEMSWTVADPALNKGMPTNIPGLWLKDGRAYHATEDEAAQLAAQSGLTFPTYQKFNEAEAASAEREKNWQKIKPQNSGQVRPLYISPMQGRR